MLVSVAVITYNSSNTVIETLNSILNQSYGSENIELIIADDASPDNTVKVINEWLGAHRTDFYNVIFIKNPVNLGVSGNINTAWKKASCEWIKSIAGDDLLHANCIQLNVDYVKEYPDCKILFSKMQMFGKSNDIVPTPYDTLFFKRNTQKQYKWLKTFSFNIAPSSFIKRSLLKDVDYANEKYRMIEDLPLWLKVTRAGHKLYFMDKVTVYYRVEESISSSQTKYINKDFITDLIKIYSDSRASFISSPLIEWVIMEKILGYKIMLLACNLSNNKVGITTRILASFKHLLRPAHSLRTCLTKVYNAYS